VVGHTKLVIAQLAVRCAISVANSIISQPFVEVEKNEQTHVVEETSESDGETYVISDVSMICLDDSQLVTLRLESGNCLRFQS
jgi:hypothetical protein